MKIKARAILNCLLYFAVVMFSVVIATLLLDGHFQKTKEEFYLGVLNFIGVRKTVGVANLLFWVDFTVGLVVVCFAIGVTGIQAKKILQSQNSNKFLAIDMILNPVIFGFLFVIGLFFVQQFLEWQSLYIIRFRYMLIDLLNS